MEETTGIHSGNHRCLSGRGCLKVPVWPLEAEIPADLDPNLRSQIVTTNFRNKGPFDHLTDPWKGVVRSNRTTDSWPLGIMSLGITEPDHRQTRPISGLLVSLGDIVIPPIAFGVPQSNPMYHGIIQKLLNQEIDPSCHLQLHFTACYILSTNWLDQFL